MNTTAPMTPTERKQKAAAALERLTSERKQILTRQQTAQATIEQLNQDLARAERSGEADTLAALRSDRREAEESVQDLARALPGLDREIELAERACCAEQYNALQTRQAALLKTIEDALDEKARLAALQQTLVINVCPGSPHNAALIRPDVIHVITGWLQGNRGLSLRTVDWSSQRMTAQGVLQ